VAPDSGSPFVGFLTELLGEHAPSRLRAFGEIVAAAPSDRHWYLAAIGTRPEGQGRGMGSEVLARGLERCDEQGLPSYLDSTNPRNVGFYARHGFRVVGVLDIDHGGATITRMWRDSAPSGVRPQLRSSGQLSSSDISTSQRSRQSSHR
jgi:GNAT superfamily N-acetyltransferase